MHRGSLAARCDAVPSCLSGRRTFFKLALGSAIAATLIRGAQASYPHPVFSNVRAIVLSFLPVGDAQVSKLVDPLALYAVTKEYILSLLRPAEYQIQILSRAEFKDQPPSVDLAETLKCVLFITCAQQSPQTATGQPRVIGAIAVRLTRGPYEFGIDPSTLAFFESELQALEIQRAVEHAINVSLDRLLLTPLNEAIQFER